MWQQHILGSRVLREGSEQRSQKTFVEGSKRFAASYRYERDPRARKACIQFHGTKCKVCGFNFSDNFGTIGEGFIHVHHLNLISEQDEEHEIDPVNDLLPVCPNCHAMLHRRSPPYSINELREILLYSSQR